MPNSTRCPDCGASWKITERKMMYRDVDTLECDCGRTLNSWNGAVTYSSQLISPAKLKPRQTFKVKKDLPTHSGMLKKGSEIFIIQKSPEPELANEGAWDAKIVFGSVQPDNGPAIVFGTRDNDPRQEIIILLRDVDDHLELRLDSAN